MQHRTAAICYALLGGIPARAFKSLILCGCLLSVSLAAGQMSHTCKFTRGPLQGQTHTLPNRSATAVGSGCSDGLTSSGITVRDPDTPESSARTSHTCRFTRGPLQGQTHTFPNREATPVGSTCSDGLTSSGIAVPDPDTPESSERTTHTCRFTRGPLQGQTHTLPNREATPVGSTCSDGLTSSGIAVPDPDTPDSSERTSHSCRFTRGPLRGQTQALSNRNPTKVGSACSDGLTSSGITVPGPS
ncbi:MAG TPA: hypothetical protein VMT53_25215 [Terriglobales bacterium]|nr:hypothetical protein [Terriglobales bacterium]